MCVASTSHTANTELFILKCLLSFFHIVLSSKCTVLPNNPIKLMILRKVSRLAAAVSSKTLCGPMHIFIHCESVREGVGRLLCVM